MDIYQFLQQHQISYQRFDHPAVYTCEQASRLRPELPGAKCKNLFLRDRKGRRHFLVVACDHKIVDLKALAEQLGLSRLGLASAERLKHYLSLEPGAVSLLAIIHDCQHRVEVVIDRAIWSQEILLCHPLVNTSTLAIPKIAIQTLLTETGHQPLILDIPARA
ncbi:prolyl-tRNA synthetase associated domain-containing protein [Dongshaea marina]|uniref:prolyl-tRNA synthetase associated domain-containing protein n=1 Tax=Dongshaea marina TaxID=2047966 RepID=UPI000D3E18D0|nr:prolyl-tRNA synthetase associated domain-containing protein [Dongshaea marina]